MVGRLVLVRVVAAVAVLVSAWVHLKLWLDGFRDLSVVGPAFLLNAVAGVVIAVLLLAWRRHWLPAFLAAGFGVATLGAFVISTTVGLFGVHEQWVGFYVFAAAVAELVAIVAGALLLVAERPWLAWSRRSGEQPQHRPSAGRPHLH
jgi:hypothetical protein